MGYLLPRMASAGRPMRASCTNLQRGESCLSLVNWLCAEEFCKLDMSNVQEAILPPSPTEINKSSQRDFDGTLWIKNKLFTRRQIR
jgi:hypothetical protein